MTYEGGVTSVNVVSAVSLKTRVIGAEMEHPGQSWYRNQGLVVCFWKWKLTRLSITTKGSVDTVNLFAFFWIMF